MEKRRAAITALSGQLYQKMDNIGKNGGRAYVDAEFKKLNQRLIDSIEAFGKNVHHLALHLILLSTGLSITQTLRKQKALMLP